MKIQAIKYRNNNNFRIKQNLNFNKNQNYQNSYTKSVYNSSCPISANYYNISFGLHNPKAALHRAELLKEEYAKKGISYLLPDNVWSTKKIMQTTQKAIDGYEKLANENNINSKSLNKLISKLLPKNVAKQIEIGDFNTDFANYLQKKGMSEFQIQYVLNLYQGFTVPEKDKTLIFLRDKFDKAENKKTFAHELKHAMTAKMTNIDTRDMYKINDNTTHDKLYNVFHVIERAYGIDREVIHSPMDKTKDNLIKNIKNRNTNTGFESFESLTKDFEQKFNEALKNNGIDFSEQNKKAIYEFFQHYAKDEKEAYSTMKVLRENYSNNKQPIGIELEELKYEFFENFFKQKVAELS